MPFKICNNWKTFHNDIENIKSSLIKNAYPPFLINKVIKKNLNYKVSKNQTKHLNYHITATFSYHIKNKLSKLCKEIGKENLNINLVFNSFKIKNCFFM